MSDEQLTDIVGFTYEADTHCQECAAERFGWCACGVPNAVYLINHTIRGAFY